MTAAMLMGTCAVPAAAADTSAAQTQEAPAGSSGDASSVSQGSDASVSKDTPAPAASSDKPSESSSASSGSGSQSSGQGSSKASSENASGNTGSSQASSETSGSASSAKPETSGETSDTSGSAASTASGSDTQKASEAQSDKSSSSASASSNSSDSSKEETTEKEPEEEKEVEEADKHEGTNEQLISQQNIQDVDIPEYTTDFRFYTADKSDTETLAAKDKVTVYEETNTDSLKVGSLRKCASATRLKDAKNGWIYIESGEVRGFAKSEWFYHGDEAQKEQKKYEDSYIADKEKEAAAANAAQAVSLKEESSKESADKVHPIDRVKIQQLVGSKEETARKEAASEAKKYLDDSRYGTALVSPSENGAYTYTRTTAQKHVTDKVPAFAKEAASIYEDKSDSSTKAGTLDKDALAFVIESGDEWTYVESGDTRGFVKTSALTTGDDAKNRFSGKKESDFATAHALVKPEDNKATYYSIVSVKEGQKTSSIREAIVKMALSCAGNPYVWGGTSLTSGADCSGFVQTLYRSFGYSLPRIACDQAKVGTQIKVSDAAPGDLIFFARNGYVYHVAMYAGDGKTIEAYSSKAGIGVHGLSGRPAVWACRIIKD